MLALQVLRNAKVSEQISSGHRSAIYFLSGEFARGILFVNTELISPKWNKKALKTLRFSASHYLLIFSLASTKTGPCSFMLGFTLLRIDLADLRLAYWLYS